MGSKIGVNKAKGKEWVRGYFYLNYSYLPGPSVSGASVTRHAEHPCSATFSATASNDLGNRAGGFKSDMNDMSMDIALAVAGPWALHSVSVSWSLDAFPFTWERTLHQLDSLSF